ncbi:hypothetical protein CQA53_08615 [Helicobacter didelphidarum]|uniref:Outer membrane lipoprotein chaperone LolA n=2 Tax=Helicobacter didelphidarum TaxID=2040648 RepID=A0A3D8IDJ5_9HELI|nr:hypothetical protein CQA53_08615 [Helicobacter didelphidarum]
MSLLYVCYGAEEWRNINSLQGDFIQEIKGERGAIPVIYSGKIYASNNKIKWEYIKPLTKEVYLEKNGAYIYEPDLKQVTIGTLKENIDFIHILKQVQKVSDNNYKTRIDGTDYLVVIKDSKLHSLSYRDSLDNNVMIIFNNIIINQPIREEIFIFQPPEGVEYIDAN